MLFVMVLSIAVTLTATYTFAQATGGSGYDTGNSNTGGANSGGTLNSTDNTNNGVSRWWWIIPLAAIPVILIALNRGRDREDDTRTYRSTRLTGAKGGRARRNREDDEVEEDVL